MSHGLHFIDLPQQSGRPYRSDYNRRVQQVLHLLSFQKSSISLYCQTLYMDGFDMDVVKTTLDRTVALFRQNLEENPDEGCMSDGSSLMGILYDNVSNSGCYWHCLWDNLNPIVHRWAAASRIRGELSYAKRTNVTQAMGCWKWFA